MDTGQNIQNIIKSDETQAKKKGGKKGNLMPIIFTAVIILAGIIIVGIYEEQISAFGTDLMTRYGQQWVDLILLLITFVSCTPLMLPVWCYALVGVALGYNVFRLAFVMAVGSASGSTVTYYLGRFFANRQWVHKRFPNLLNHPWAEGKSKMYVSWILFLGTASPIPCDVFYAACGAKQYPALPFFLLMVAGRFVRYIYLGYGFNFFSNIF